MTPPHVLRLIVVRHAATRATGAVLNGCGVGADDPPLLSPADAVAIGERLRAIGVRPGVHLWCSATRRARATAEGLGFGSPRVDPRLNEVDFGAWEGRTPADVFATSGEAYLRLWADPLTAPPGGESVAHLSSRLAEWRHERQQDATVIAVGHASTVRVLIGQALAVPSAATQRIGVPAGAFADVRFYPDGAGSVERLESPV